MKTNTFILISFFLVMAQASLHAQGKTTLEALKNGMTPDQTQQLDLVYKALLDKEFTRVLTGNTSEFGSLAKISTEDEKLDFSGTLRLFDFSNLVLSGKAGVTEGIASLVKGGETSPNITLGGQFNLGIYKNSTMYLDGTQIQNYENKLKNLRIETLKKRIEIDGQKIAKEFEIREKEYKVKESSQMLTSFRKKRMELMAKLTGAERLASKVQFSIDSVNFLILKTELDSSFAQSKIVLLNRELNLITADYIAVQKQLVEEKKVADAKAAMGELELEGYNLRWFSFGAKINNRTFKSFADSLSYAQQIQKFTYNSVELIVSHNHYRINQEVHNRLNYFTSIGISYKITDNFDDLNSVTLENVDTVATAPTHRLLRSNSTVYTGEYKRDISELKLFYDLYYFLGKSRQLAVHFNPSAVNTFRDKFKSEVNCKVGLLFGIRDQKDAANIVNIELFYSVNDLFTKLEEGERFDDRTEFGISPNTPINFKYKK